MVINTTDDMLKEENKYCKYCFNVIHKEAKVCPFCNKYQNKLFNNIFSINSVTTIISILLLILSFFQYRDSSIEKTEALNASTKSKLALEKIRVIEKSISRDRIFVSDNTKYLSLISQILIREVPWSGRTQGQLDTLNGYFKHIREINSEFLKAKLK